MNAFKISDTQIPGLKVVEPFYAADLRGSFMKVFEKNNLKELGIHFDVSEVFFTHSGKGVLRGLHFQRRFCQDKLVLVLSGAVYDVAVDLREGSETFGKWQGFHLSAENRKLLYIPKGFAHGFLSLEENTMFGYLCGDCYDPDTDGGILWNDPQLAICWPLEQLEQPVLSQKDASLPTLAEFLEVHGALRTVGNQ